MRDQHDRAIANVEARSSLPIRCAFVLHLLRHKLLEWQAFASSVRSLPAYPLPVAPGSAAMHFAMENTPKVGSEPTSEVQCAGLAHVSEDVRRTRPGREKPHAEERGR